MPNLQNQFLGESGQIVTTGDTGTVTSVMIASNTIVDADISTAAAISLSKLATSTAGNIIVYNASGVPTSVAESGDVTISDSGVTAISSNVIVNADINTGAAIALSKLASGTSAQIVLANATGVPTYTTLSGVVTITDAGLTALSTSANPTIAGLTANSATGKIILNTDAGGSVSIGNTAGVASTPYIDFNSGATAVDFDTRIQASGGSGVSGGGTLTITSANTIISGNLTINGTTTTVNTATLNVSDNIIILNNDVTGTPTENAGIEVERGTSPNVSIRWNETTDKWQFTTDGTNYTDFGSGGGASVSDTAPASPVAGQIWFESDTGQTFVYYSDGTSSQWVEIGASGTAAFVGDSAPSNPVTGQIWFNSSNAGTYVYYSDGTSSQWIEVGAQPQTLNIGDTAPASPVSGQLWYNSSDGGTYVYYGSAWVEVGAAPYNTLLNLIDAKGDLFVGSADNTVVKLGVGNDNQFLVANSSTASGLSWSAIEDDQVILAGRIFG
jgi:hypothetical protein